MFLGPDFANIHIDTQDSIEKFMNAVFDGWEPSVAGAEAREILSHMSWVGRQHSSRFIEHIAKNKDP